LDNRPITPPSAISFRLADARANLDQDEKLVREMAAIFIADVPSLCARLAAIGQGAGDDPMVDGEKAAELHHLAHSLKGLAATFGAQPLGELAAGLEEASVAEESAAGIDSGRFAECDAEIVRNGGWVALGNRTAQRLAAELGMSPG
jgi:HPt (histidine-containing phosphotransfer) domain-containing protein